MAEVTLFEKDKAIPCSVTFFCDLDKNNIDWNLIFDLFCPDTDIQSEIKKEAKSDDIKYIITLLFDVYILYECGKMKKYLNNETLKYRLRYLDSIPVKKEISQKEQMIRDAFRAGEDFGDMDRTCTTHLDEDEYIKSLGDIF